MLSSDRPEGCPDGLACVVLPAELAIEPEPSERVGFEGAPNRYYQPLELPIYQVLGMDQTPYTCREIGGEENLGVDRARGWNGIDVEHIVAQAEAHDSGLPPEDRVAFATDPANLTLAFPRENRNVKNEHDAAVYLPSHNRCWFAARVVAVKQKWGLSVDQTEADALDKNYIYIGDSSPFVETTAIGDSIAHSRPVGRRHDETEEPT